MDLQKFSEPETKAVTQITTPFLNSGDCWDEVTFEFDGGKKLYVSQNFLSMASPVFKEMFGNNSEEEKTKRVHKVFEDFLEFLMCLHPNIQKPVTSENVLSVSGIAAEYQCSLIINRCKSELSRYLQHVTQSIVSIISEEEKYSSALICLKILMKAHELNYDQHVTEAIKTTAQLNFIFFTGIIIKSIYIMQPHSMVFGSNFGQRKPRSKKNTTFRVPTTRFAFGTPVVKTPPKTTFPFHQSNPPRFTRSKEDVAKDCKQLYEGLPEKLKFRLLMERLGKCDIHDID